MSEQTSHNSESSSGQELANLELVQESCQRLLDQLARQVIGQQDVLKQLLLALFARGHCLLVGVPGLAKTLMIRTLARALDLKYSRIQFTPDLMPSDITGTEVIQSDRQTGERHFQFRQGPVFANILLADEINRTPPKTQAALLEAMQESMVTIGGESHALPDPFFVLATQNPIEQEGTYPLPEAQLDRFMFHVRVDYPSHDEEREIVKQTTLDSEVEIEPVMDGEQILAIGRLVREIPIADHVADYCLGIVRSSRPDREQASEMVREYVSWGAGPRASQFLVLAAKSHALLAGRYAVEYEDIDAVAHPVLRHRLRLNFQAEAASITSDSIIDHLLEQVRQRELAGQSDGRSAQAFGSPHAGQP